MKLIKFLLFFLFFSFSVYAQIIPKDTIGTGDIMSPEMNTLLNDTIQLEEVLIGKGMVDVDSRKEFEILRSRVYRTYPYAKLAAERLISLNKGMASLKTNKEKKKYFKIIENYLSNEFEANLKKLSRKQGQILIKLIYRQTGITTYDLVKSLKSGWSAFWSNTTAKMFDLNLKAEYLPYQVNEDYLIESILIRAFESRRLMEQKSANPVDYDNLNAYWIEKSEKTNN